MPNLDPIVALMRPRFVTSHAGGTSKLSPLGTLTVSLSSPNPLPYLTVVPLQTLQRYDGEVREGIGRG